MKKELAIKTIENIGNGRIIRVGYSTELPLKAEFKKQGYRMIKIVDTSVRTGVEYGNIESVKARKEAEQSVPTKRANNFEWVVKNKVRHNTNTGKDYLYVASLPHGHNTRTRYILECTFVGTIDMGDEIVDAYKHLLIDSYFKRHSEANEVRNISLDNIIHINNIK